MASASGRAGPDLRRPALEVAPLLLGCILRTPDAAVRLVEVEAYEGDADPASHAYRGLTRRNAVMFGSAGHLYVYRLHGHTCANIVCGTEGVASAVLLRAGEVVDGLDAVRTRRPGVADAALARGPGNLCRALGIGAAHYGVPLTGPEVLLVPGDGVQPVASGPRVNVSSAADLPWRFWITGSPAVSTYKRHAATG
jgi:DNA-3-methyladenine glycosylase